LSLLFTLPLLKFTFHALLVLLALVLDDQYQDDCTFYLPTLAFSQG
jgi:hypothetical protein